MLHSHTCRDAHVHSILSHKPNTTHRRINGSRWQSLKVFKAIDRGAENHWSHRLFCITTSHCTRSPTSWIMNVYYRADHTSYGVDVTRCPSCRAEQSKTLVRITSRVRISWALLTPRPNRQWKSEYARRWLLLRTSSWLLLYWERLRKLYLAATSVQ